MSSELRYSGLSESLFWPVAQYQGLLNKILGSSPGYGRLPKNKFSFMAGCPVTGKKIFSDSPGCPGTSKKIFLFSPECPETDKIFILSSPGYEATGENLFEASPSYCGTGQISSGGNLQGEKMGDCQSPAICSFFRQL